MTANIENRILQGDCIEVMSQLLASSIDCVITSPPYYGLRTYLKGDQDGKHMEIGSEKDHEGFLSQLLAVTEEIKRLLKKDGSLWINIGDVYASHGTQATRFSHEGNQGKHKLADGNFSGRARMLNYPAKSMLMSPERLAIKMIDEQGWILRQKIVWVKQVLFTRENITKGAAMPASVKDRFNNTWEYLFHFTKSKKYYFDLSSVRIPIQCVENRPNGMERCREYGYDSKFNAEFSPQGKQSGHRTDFGRRNHDGYCGKFTGNTEHETFGTPRARTQRKADGREKNDGNGRFMPVRWINPDGKNIPNVWQINPEKNNHKKELGVDVDHYAAFPQELVRIPIISSCPPDGIVLDPFMGSGTVAFVAKQEGRSYLGIELNPDYIKLAEKRIEKHLGKLPIEKMLNNVKK